uniref:WAT1-related protein n=1 Tax=Glycine max TaxID=3847 RepID=A0A0R0JJ20_SOYBN
MEETCSRAGFGKKFTKAKPYLLTVGLQFGFAGGYIFSVASLNHGMSRYVFVVYRNAIAALALAPFALIVMCQGFTFLGMQYTSASFASAIMNAVPPVTFVLAVILRLERVNVKEVRSLAKLIGTLVTFSGALLMTFTKVLKLSYFSLLSQPTTKMEATLLMRLSGTVFLLLGCVAWSSFFILQSITLKRYPAEFVVAIVATRHSGLVAWALGWDFRLHGPLYTGIVTSEITYYAQGLVLQTRGPVFLTAFNPLCMVITSALAALGSFLFAEQLHQLLTA